MKHSLIKRKLGRVEKALDKSIEKAEIPGAVVLARMLRDGELLEFECVRGHAVLQPERLPMARSTVFDLASLTKPMATNAAILLLVKDGLLNLDDPVAKVLPAFGDRDKDAVTLRHLLTLRLRLIHRLRLRVCDLHLLLPLVGPLVLPYRVEL